jgi:hypothetical protein
MIAPRQATLEFVSSACATVTLSGRFPSKSSRLHDNRRYDSAMTFFSLTHYNALAKMTEEVINIAGSPSSASARHGSKVRISVVR